MTGKALIHAHLLDGAGRTQELDWSGLRQAETDRALYWAHFQLGEPETGRWLREESGLDPLIVDALMAETTRPRCMQIQDGLLLILRGVNLNPGAEPDDMVSIRLWVEARRIISVCLRHLMSVQDMVSALQRGAGPASVPQFITQLSSGLVERMDGVITELDDMVDGLETQILEKSSTDHRRALTEVRYTVIGLRRYIAPQREAMARLSIVDVPWLDHLHRNRLREVADRVQRYVEDLDSVRDRGAVIQDELTIYLSERMNRTVYLLSLVGGIFLPLSFLTGLLGINVGGIPGEGYDFAFAIVCGLALALGVVEIWLFRWLRWL